MNIRWTIAAAAMALSACAGSGGPKNQAKSDIERAQIEAQHAFERAAQVQQKANEAQARAEQAQREVTREQKQLAEAEAGARSLMIKAQQQQAEARRLAQETARQAQEAQQHALRLQEVESQRQRQMHQRKLRQWSQTHNIEGTALGTDGGTLRLRGEKGDLQLRLNPSTAITVDGRLASASQIQPGTDVRASYVVIDGQPTALTVDMTSKTNPSSGSSSTQGDPR